MTDITDLTQPETLRITDVSFLDETIDQAVLTPSVQALAGGIAKKVFGPDSENIETEEDLKAANELGADMYKEDKMSEVQEAVYKGATQGRLTPEQAFVLTSSLYDEPVEDGLYARYAQQIVAEQQAREPKSFYDTQAASALSETNESFVRKQLIAEEFFRSVSDKANGETKGHGLYDFLPLANMVQSIMYEKREGSTSWLPQSIKAENYEELQDLLYNPARSPEEVKAFLQERYNSLKSDGLSDEQINHYFKELIDPSLGTARLSMIGDVSSFGLSGLGVRLAAKKAGTQVLKQLGEGEVAKRLAKKAAVEAGVKQAGIETVGQVVPFGDVVATKVVKALKTPSNLTDPANIKLSIGSTNAAAESLTNDLKALKVGAATENSVPTLIQNIVDSQGLPVATAGQPVAHKAELLSELGLQEMERQLVYQIGLHSNNLAGLGKEAVDKYIRSLDISLKGVPQSVFADLTGWGRAEEASGDIILTARKGTGLTSGDGFVSLEGAEKLAKAINKTQKGASLHPKAYPVQVGDKFYVDIEIPLHRSTGSIFAEYANESGKGLRQQSGRFALAQNVATLPGLSHDVRLMNSVVFQDVEAMQGLLDSLSKNVKHLDKASRELLNEAMQESIQSRRWFTPEELDEVGFTDNMIKAYGARRIVNDVAYILDNVGLRNQLKASGYKKINGLIARRVKPSTIPEGDLTYAVLNGEVVGDLELFTKREAVEYIEKNNFVVIKNLYDQDISSADYLLVHGDQIIEEELPTFILNYVAGGRRWYSNELTYVKQLDMTKHNAIKGIRTLFGDADASKTTRFVEDLEDLRQRLIKNTLTDEYLQAKNPVLLPFSSVDEFRQYLKDARISLIPSARLEAVKNNVPLASFDEAIKAGAKNAIDTETLKDINGLSQYYLQKHTDRALQRHRSDRKLFDLLGNDSQMVDYKEEMNLLRQHIEASGGMQAYTKMYAERFLSTYKHVLNTDSYRTPYDALMYGTLHPAKGAYKADVEAAQAMRENYFAIRNIPSELDKKIGSMVYDFVSSVEDVLGFSKRDYKNATSYSKSFEFLKKHNPLTHLRALTFHTFMGMLSPVQLIRQFGQVINSVALASPSAAPRALAYFMPAVSQLMSGNLTTIKAMSKAVASANPEVFKAGDFEAVMEALPFLPIYGHGLQGGFNVDNFANMGKWSRLSAAPMIAGETGARLMNNLLALTEAGINSERRWGNLSKLEQAEIINRANNLYLNMNRTGLSRAQHDVLGRTVLQLSSFNLRCLDALLDPEHTKGAKARLALLLFGLTGVQGVLGTKAASWVYQAVYDGEDTEEPDDTIMEVILNGAGNMLMTELTGRDYDWFGMAGPELLDYLIDLPEVLQAKVPAITTVSKLYNSISTALQAAGYMVSGEDLTNEDYNAIIGSLVTQRDLPSGINRYYLGKRIMEEGILQDSKGNLVAKDLDTLDAVLYTLGFDLKAQSSDYLIKTLIRAGNQDRAEITKDLTNMTKSYILRGDYSGAARMIHLYLRDLPASERYAIKKEVLQNARRVNETTSEQLERTLIRSRYRNAPAEAALRHNQ